MRTRAICALALLLALAGCGGTKKQCLYKGIKCENLPKPKVFHVNWTDKANIEGKPIATFRVRTIEIRPRGWTLTATITNTSPRTIRFPSGGPRSPIDFGLGVFVSPLPQRIEAPGNYLLREKSVKPRFPRELAPGRSWSGTMTSDEPPRNKRWLRVLFGAFFWKGKPPYGLSPFFVWQTTRTVQAPGPVGTAPS